jgi:hypothetical protein
MNANKDWTGNSQGVFKMLGSTNHSNSEREVNDFYATDPKAIAFLLNMESFSKDIWECACGAGHLSKELINNGYKVKSTDIVDRGYGEPNINFLSKNIIEWGGDIITNPPYRYAVEFIVKALNIISEGNKVAMFLRVQFMEGKGRKNLFLHHPPKIIYVLSSRINCAKNGDFSALRKNGGSPIAYAWYVWEKGYKGNTILKWFN